MIIPLTGIEGWMPFLIGAAVILASAIAFLPVRRIAPKFDDHQTMAVLSFFKVAPTLMAAVAAVAVIDGALIVHLAVYGLRLEVTLAVAAGMVSAFMIGNVFLQVPLGWMADRLNGYRVLAVCAISGILCGLAIAALGPSDALLWPVLVIWGGSTYGMYTVALTLLGHRFSGTNLVAANAAFALMWGAGGIAGPAAGGLAMDVIGPHGLPLTVVLTCFLFLTLLIFRRLRIPGR
jgi:MFS family permease